MHAVGFVEPRLVHPRLDVARGKSSVFLWMWVAVNVPGTRLGALSVSVTKITLGLVSSAFFSLSR